MSNIIIKNGDVTLAPEIVKSYCEMQMVIDTMKAEQEKIKEALKNEMELKGIIKLETPEMIVNYIGESDREKFDTKRFKKDNPDLYDEYITMSKVKAYIKAKVKHDTD